MLCGHALRIPHGIIWSSQSLLYINKRCISELSCPKCKHGVCNVYRLQGKVFFMVYWKLGFLRNQNRLKIENWWETFSEGLQGRIKKKYMSNRTGADTMTRTDEKRRAHIRCYFTLHHGGLTIKFEIKLQFPICIIGCNIRENSAFFPNQCTFW